MTEQTSLYMFAIMPSSELAEKIHNERINFAEEFGYVKGLKPPVHITLYEPFQIPSSETSTFETGIRSIQKWADTQQSFEIELKNFNYFDHGLHPVVYIDVVRNNELKALHSGFVKELKRYIEMKKQRDTYRPHITIGYRDIPVQAFKAIREVYSKKRFSAAFNCRSFYLWKHDGKNWQVKHEFLLNGIKEQMSLF